MGKLVKMESEINYWTSEQMGVLKRMIAPQLNDDELVIFSHICKRTNLDPFAKQIYGQKRAGKLVIITAVDGFRVIAERTGRYSPGKDTEFIYDEKGALLGAKVFVKKQTPDGTWHEMSATAFLREYTTGQGCWKSMPHVMIEKCAECRAIRRAFPADLSGIYSSEEMEQADIAKVSEEQFERLNAMLEYYPSYREKMLGRLKTKYGASSLREMPSELYEIVVTDLSKRSPETVVEEQQVKEA